MAVLYFKQTQQCTKARQKLKDSLIISSHKGSSIFTSHLLASSLNIIYTKLFKNISDVY